MEVVSSPEAFSPPLDETLVLGILQFAVRVARDEQIRRLDSLKRILAVEFPENEREINAAIQTWANYHGRKGNPRYRS